MTAATDHPSPAPTETGLTPLPESDKAGRSLRRGLITVTILVAVAAGLILAVPGLHGVGRTVTHMPTGWIAVAVGLELLSCSAYVLAFLQVFERAPILFGSRVALSEQAFGAAVPLGGAGAVGIGAWLMIERGGPPALIAERSAVLFLLTSAVNVITLILAGLGLFLGILPGPDNPLLSIVPAGVGIAVITFFLCLPRLSDLGVAHRAPGKIATVMTTTAESVRHTRRLLVRPNWRIIGAFGFLWCDIAVLVVCFAATGHSPPLAAIILAYQIGYLSNLVPIPGGIGVLDGGLVAMLVVYGVATTPAAAATLVYHAIALWIPALGTFAFITLRRTRHEPLTLRPTLAERRSERAKRN